MLVGSEAAAREYFDEALAKARQIDDRFTEAGVHTYLGLGLTLAGDLAGRASAWRALGLLQGQGYALGTITALEILAAQLGLRAQHAEAARLVGEAQAQRSATTITATTICYADYKRLYDMARGSLDEASFAAACAAGRELTIEQALALAESRA